MLCLFFWFCKNTSSNSNATLLSFSAALLQSFCGVLCWGCSLPHYSKRVLKFNPVSIKNEGKKKQLTQHAANNNSNKGNTWGDTTPKKGHAMENNARLLCLCSFFI